MYIAKSLTNTQHMELEPQCTEGYNLGTTYLIEMVFKYYYKYVQYISNKYTFEL